jgi:sigma-B regulation protein RsbU (phosphoserine phosphatase)
MDAAGDCFGEQRLSECLETNADRGPEAIRDAVVGEVAAFAQGQPQHDDITMMILKFDADPRAARGEAGTPATHG